MKNLQFQKLVVPIILMLLGSEYNYHHASDKSIFIKSKSVHFIFLHCIVVEKHFGLVKMCMQLGLVVLLEFLGNISADKFRCSGKLRPREIRTSES